MKDDELVKLSDSFAAYYEFIEGDDTINGQTLGLVTELLGVEPQEYADVDVLMLIEQVLQNYHQWHKINAGEGE
jgi:hypothetical protein